MFILLHNKTFIIRYFNLIFSITADVIANLGRGTRINHKRVSGEQCILYIWLKILYYYNRQAAVIKNILVLMEILQGVIVAQSVRIRFSRQTEELCTFLTVTLLFCKANSRCFR